MLVEKRKVVEKKKIKNCYKTENLLKKLYIQPCQIQYAMFLAVGKISNYANLPAPTKQPIVSSIS